MDTPVTDAVRNQTGDYIALVENLEQSHKWLLAFAQRFTSVKDLASLQDFEWVSLRDHARAAIVKATGKYPCQP